MHRFFRFCLLIAVTVTSLSAAVYQGDSFTFHQPDGSTFRVRIWGDEFAIRAESGDGWAVIKGADRWWYFAQPAAGGGIEVSSMRVGAGDPATLGVAHHLRPSKTQRAASAAERRQLLDRDSRGRVDSPLLRQARAARQAAVAAAPGGPLASPGSDTRGIRKGITLMIRFPDLLDEANDIDRSEVDDFCNGDNYTDFGNNGSIKEYFYDNSKGRLTYTNTVVDYYTATHNRSYYADDMIDHGIRARELVIEALTAADLAGFDFSTCDGNNDGIIDGVNVFYAGICPNSWGFGLWPHQSGVDWTSNDGVRTAAYQITDMGAALTIGTFCHENGHMICDFPDLYDYGDDEYSGESIVSIGGAGDFCLMGYGGNGDGGRNPVRVCGYLALSAKWRDPVDLHNAASGQRTIQTESETIFRYRKSGSLTEYFLIENRNTGSASGRDASLPCSGLAIWHCDEQGQRDNQNYAKPSVFTHYECALIQADNLHEFETQDIDAIVDAGGYPDFGDANDLWYLGNGVAGYTNRFEDGDGLDPEANDARWWNGTASSMIISGISAPGPSMTFTCGETTLSLSAAAYTVAEGNSGTTYATISVARTGSTAGSATLTWTASDGTATIADLDHPGFTGTLTWGNGVGGTKTFRVPVYGDTKFEGSETILIHITPAAGILTTRADATLTVTNDDIMPAAGSIELVSYTESVIEGGALVIQVQRVGGSVGDVSVAWSILPGTATAGTDYTVPVQILSWANGVMGIQTVTIPTSADATPEADETFRFVLGTATGSAIAPTPNTLTASILNDDYNVGFNFNTIRCFEPNSGTLNMPATVKHTGAIHATFTVDYTITAGTATSGIDFAPIANGTLTWDTSTTVDPSILVPVLYDALTEGIETLTITLSNPVGTTLSAIDTITVEIVDQSNRQYTGSVDGTAGTSWANGSGCGTGTSALLLGLSLVGLGFFPRRRRQR